MLQGESMNRMGGGTHTDLHSCEHCNLPIPAQDLVVDSYDGCERLFCCHGCKAAFRIIHGAGLGDFYKKRDWGEPGVVEGAFNGNYDDTWLSTYVENLPDGSAAFIFLIEGVRCATCVWLNERILRNLSGVLDARLNYGTHRARVIFDPAQTSPGQIFQAVAALGYSPRPYSRDAASESHLRERHALLIRFGTAFFLSMQLMGYSLALYAGFFQGIDAATRHIIQIFAAAVTTPVVFYAGAPFLKGGFRSLRNRAPDMDLLISLGVLAAYGTSLHALVAGGDVYFDTAAMIVTLLLAGRLFENSARQRAANGIDHLLHLAPDSALRIGATGSESVPTASLRPGDIVLVRPGDRFPTDGCVTQGSSEIDTSAATGEPLPRPVSRGDAVLSGTMNLLSPVEVEVTVTAGESFMARVARLVEEAQSRKAPVQRLADRIAALFVPLVLLIAAGSACYWQLQGDSSTVPLLAAVSVLVVACPCALGLATPTAILVASGRAAQLGILFRGGDTLETCGKVTLVAFDKTGTLTTGKPTVCAVTCAPSVSEDELFRELASLEQTSSHPLAVGIVQEARRRNLTLTPAPPSENRAGLGLVAQSSSGRQLAGNDRLLRQFGITPPVVASPPGTPVHYARGDTWFGTVFLEDSLREGALQTIQDLTDLGLETVLLTGDLSVRAEPLAGQLGIAQVHAELTPDDKARLVDALQQQGEVVLMAGDGINDAPALGIAQVGCAMGGGTDIALDTSELVLTRSDPRQLVTAIRLSRQTLRVIRQNLCWAFAYNLCVLPLAAAGMLYPVYAAAAMALSSICVVTNSLRLRKGRI